jgi:SOS-response transcriptional repressor LexA
MIDAGILEDDIAIVRRDLEAHHGHIVCATLDGESTLKTLCVESDGAWLVPANPRYSRFRLPADATIHGVLQATFRNYTVSRPADRTGTTSSHPRRGSTEGERRCDT